MMRSPLFTGLLVVVLIAVLWFGVWPLYGRVAAARTEIKNLRVSIEEEKAATVRLEELTRRMEERKDDIAKLEVAIPENKDLASLIAVFEEAASINGLRLKGVSFPADTGVDGEARIFSRAPAELELSGRYPSFRTLLSDIERSFPLMDISTISFRPQAEDNLGAAAQYDFTVTIHTYHLR